MTEVYRATDWNLMRPGPGGAPVELARRRPEVRYTYATIGGQTVKPMLLAKPVDSGITLGTGHGGTAIKPPGVKPFRVRAT